MGQTVKATRENRTITVDFQDQTTYFRLLDDTTAFVEFVLAFFLSLGFQLKHKSTCPGGGGKLRNDLLYASASLRRLAFLRQENLQGLQKQRYHSLEGLGSPVGLMMHRRNTGVGGVWRGADPPLP